MFSGSCGNSDHGLAKMQGSLEVEALGRQRTPEVQEQDVETGTGTERKGVHACVGAHAVGRTGPE